MCTALAFHGLFGRTLDLEWSLNETVTLTPRDFPIRLCRLPAPEHHHAILGMAHVSDGYPLYYDAVNEHGLAMAGLNFPHSAFYPPARADRSCVAPYELIGFVLGQCTDTAQARDLLAGVEVAALDFSPQLKRTPMHWLICDRSGSCLAVEPTRDGLQLTDDPVGVLANEPLLPIHLLRLRDYMHLSPQQPENRMAPGLELTPYSRGAGALGLPGDFSSPSRFVRTAFLSRNAVPAEGEERLSQFFHIMDSVCVVDGSVQVPEGRVRTVYTSCCDLNEPAYCFITYKNRQITRVRLACPEGRELVCWPTDKAQQILDL